MEKKFGIVSVMMMVFMVNNVNGLQIYPFFNGQNLYPNTTQEVGHLNFSTNENETYNNINIYILNSPLEYIFSNNSFKIYNNTNTTIRINVSVPNLFQPLNLNPKLMIFTDGNKTLEQPFTNNISQIENIYIENQNTSITANTTQIGKFGISIKNMGNVNLKINATANGSFISFPIQEFELPYLTTQSFNVNYKIPEKQKQNTYFDYIFLSYGSNNATINATFNILDNITPSIDLKFFENITFGDAQNIQVLTKDNVEVANQSFFVISPTKKNITKKEFDIDEIGEWTIYASVTDTSNLSSSVQRKFNSTKILPKFFKNKIEMGKTRIHKQASTQLYIPSKAHQLRITLKDISFSGFPLANFTGNIYIANQQINPIIGAIIDLENVDSNNGIDFSILSDNETSYFVDLEFLAPSYVDIQSDVQVFGRFVNFTIQKYATLEIGRGNMTCEGIDTEQEETSYHICKFTLPATDDIKKEVVAVPYKWIDEMIGTLRKQADTEKNNKNFNFTIFIISMLVNVILILGLVWYLKISPYYKSKF